MPRTTIKTLLFALITVSTLDAKTLIDCRVVTGGISECNPYGKRLHHIKKVSYELDRQKLIIVKNLPLPDKTFVKVISVEDMIEKYVHIEAPVRFKGSDSDTLQVEVVNTTVKKEIELRVAVTEIPVLPVEVDETEMYGTYCVESGDVLSRLANKFGISVKELTQMNDMTPKSTLRIGKKLKLPLEQERIDVLATACYTVQERDTLISIAHKFGLSAKSIVKFNNIKDATRVRTGKVLKLPFPYVLAEIKAKRKRLEKEARRAKLDIKAFGKHSLRVTATAYTSHRGQTDATPFLAAWNNRLRPGVKSIAVSRDMLTRYGMRNGTKVRIAGIRGYYRVRDKMNKRYKKRIDIYMGLDRRRALRWGRRSVVIYW
ncbi:MAG: LysM peptidoglycan-binding domain-containing protein [Sulfurovum sp.]|nr:LysM peptidoglycan-binding domain-containing protein [Sulfurovum sp.]